MQIEMQPAVLPVGLGLFRYLPWAALARHISQGLSPISTTLGKFHWKRHLRLLVIYGEPTFLHKV